MEQGQAGEKLTLLLPLDGSAAGGAGERLLDRIRCADATLAAVLGDWLGEVFTAPSLSAALARRAELSASACCVTPGGDIVSRQSITLFAPDAGEHGLLERQREIDELGGLIEQRDEMVEEAQAKLAGVETRMLDAQNALQEARKHLDELQNRAHAIQVEALKLSQALDRFRERQAQIDDSLAEMTAEEEGERERLFVADEAIEGEREQLMQLQTLMSNAKARFEQAERALRDEREQVNGVERELREAQFSQRECRNKLEEIAANGNLARKQLERIVDELARCADNADAMQAEDLEPKLQDALEQRVTQNMRWPPCVMPWKPLPVVCAGSKSSA